MSTIKSFAVGNGDMFYINHNSDNFTIIDCCLCDDTEKAILDEIYEIKKSKEITRFISTHPDEDHLRGLVKLDDKIDIINFYCVANKVTKEDESESFKKYCELRDSSKAFNISKDCTRKWMNLNSDERGSSGINILWPDTSNKHYKEELALAEATGCPNNISAIVKYSLNDGVTALWFGDLETEFMEKIENAVNWPKADIVFAPHHGRSSGKIPQTILEKISPKVVIVGEAPCEHLHYYGGYNTITQNSAGDILFECNGSTVDIFTSRDYEVDFLEDNAKFKSGYYYLGTLEVGTENQQSQEKALYSASASV